MDEAVEITMDDSNISERSDVKEGKQNEKSLNPLIKMAKKDSSSFLI